MAVITTANPTLLDLAQREDPNGKIAAIIELLNQQNEILDDMTWIEGNLKTGHRTTVRTGLPTPTWRKLYGGVQPTHSTTAQVDESCGMMEDYAEVDKALADLADDTATFRLQEDAAHLEGFNQELAKALFFGNADIEPVKFTGFAPRFNDLSAENADNIIDAGGTGSNNTSIWLVVWGPTTVHGIIPRNSKAGFQATDKGQVTIENVDGQGGRMEAYRTHYRWDVGLCVRDWRYVVRIANIDKTTLTKDASAGADLIDLMTQAVEIPPSMMGGRPVFYVNQTIRSVLRRQIVNKVAQSTLSRDEIAGRKVVTFDGIPVRRVDALAINEARVV